MSSTCCMWRCASCGVDGGTRGKGDGSFGVSDGTVRTTSQPPNQPQQRCTDAPPSGHAPAEPARAAPALPLRLPACVATAGRQQSPAGCRRRCQLPLAAATAAPSLPLAQALPRQQPACGATREPSARGAKVRGQPLPPLPGRERLLPRLPPARLQQPPGTAASPQRVGGLPKAAASCLAPPPPRQGAQATAAWQQARPPPCQARRRPLQRSSRSQAAAGRCPGPLQRLRQARAQLQAAARPALRQTERAAAALRPAAAAQAALPLLPPLLLAAAPRQQLSQPTAPLPEGCARRCRRHHRTRWPRPPPKRQPPCLGPGSGCLPPGCLRLRCRQRWRCWLLGCGRHCLVTCLPQQPQQLQRSAAAPSAAAAPALWRQRPPRRLPPRGRRPCRHPARLAPAWRRCF